MGTLYITTGEFPREVTTCRSQGEVLDQSALRLASDCTVGRDTASDLRFFLDHATTLVQRARLRLAHGRCHRHRLVLAPHPSQEARYVPLQTVRQQYDLRAAARRSRLASSSLERRRERYGSERYPGEPFVSRACRAVRLGRGLAPRPRLRGIRPTPGTAWQADV